MDTTGTPPTPLRRTVSFFRPTSKPKPHLFRRPSYYNPAAGPSATAPSTPSRQSSHTSRSSDRDVRTKPSLTSVPSWSSLASSASASASASDSAPRRRVFADAVHDAVSGRLLAVPRRDPWDIDTVPDTPSELSPTSAWSRSSADHLSNPKPLPELYIPDHFYANTAVSRELPREERAPADDSLSSMSSGSTSTALFSQWDGRGLMEDRALAGRDSFGDVEMVDGPRSAPNLFGASRTRGAGGAIPALALTASELPPGCGQTRLVSSLEGDSDGDEVRARPGPLAEIQRNDGMIGVASNGTTSKQEASVARGAESGRHAACAERAERRGKGKYWKAWLTIGLVSGTRRRKPSDNRADSRPRNL